jgi:hypothetical protein
MSIIQKRYITRQYKNEYRPKQWVRPYCKLTICSVYIRIIRRKSQSDSLNQNGRSGFAIILRKREYGRSGKEHTV